MGKVDKACTVCGKAYKVVYSRRNSMFCSKKCMGVSRKGKDLPQFIHIKGVRSNTGRTHFKKGVIPHNWKGDGVGYAGIHKWVYSHGKKENKCSVCGRTDAKRYEWANVSHEYKRDLKDWATMCTSCHQRYDGSRYTMWTTRRKVRNVE